MRTSIALLAFALLAPATVSAQTSTALPQQQIDDVRTIGEKFVALAEAFPAETYDWRPMEGVRSVREVMSLMIAEFYLFPVIWGHDVPEGVPGTFAPAMAQFDQMSKDELIAQLTTSSRWILQSVEGMTDAQRGETVDWFGTPMTAEAALNQAAGDMHEHLGQAIAYARSNRVVPPWSR